MTPITRKPNTAYSKTCEVFLIGWSIILANAICSSIGCFSKSAMNILPIARPTSLLACPDSSESFAENANITIESNDKGINSDSEVLIVGGNVNFDTKGECITGKVVNILGGKINLKSDDDAINSTDGDQNKKDNQIGVYTRIIGGELNIDSTMDGIDSNGDLYLEGGKVFISASESDNERIIDS